MVEIIVHKDYDPATMINDVALIKVTEPVMLSEKIMPVCLPPQDDSPFKYFDCFVTGFGTVDTGK